MLFSDLAKDILCFRLKVDRWLKTDGPSVHRW